MSPHTTTSGGTEALSDRREARDPRSAGDEAHAALSILVNSDDDWDMLDLEWRAEESAAMDAYERGLIFA